MPDARPIDAGGVDAPVVPDARPDAPPQPDAPPVITADAGADARLCPSAGGCTHVGVNCLANGQEQNCAMVNGCLVPSGAPATCSSHQTCKDNSGCTCNVDPLCPNGDGTYCATGNTQVRTCSVDPDDGCVVPEATLETCTAPKACSGAAGDAACACPTQDTGSVGSFCANVNDRECSGDKTSVLVCIKDAQTACQVWDDGTFNDMGETANPGDNCEPDGLTCNNIQCQCPQNNTSDKYTNGNHFVKLKRAKRPQLVQNGLKFPGICSFESVTIALENANFSNGAGHSNLARVIIDNCDDGIDPGDGSCESIFFDNETHPWFVPANVQIITVQNTAAGGNGQLTPDAFVVEVNDWDQLRNTNGGSNTLNGEQFTAAVTVADQGKISGFTLIEGGCDTDGDGILDEYCYDKFTASNISLKFWPNVMVQLLDSNTFRFIAGTTTREEPVVEAMHLHGGGGPAVFVGANNADAVGGTFSLSPDEPGVMWFKPTKASVMTAVKAHVADGVSLSFPPFFPAVAGANTGTFGPVRVVKDKDDVEFIAFYNPTGAAGAYAGPYLASLMGDIDVGLLVGYDDQNQLDDLGPKLGNFEDTNSRIADLQVSNFSSWNGTKFYGARHDTVTRELASVAPSGGIQQGLSRIGVLVDDDFIGPAPATGPQAQGPDRVLFERGRFWDNDTGIAFTDGHSELNETVIEWSTGQGAEVNDECGASDPLDLVGETPTSRCAANGIHDDTTVLMTNVTVKTTVSVEPFFATAITNPLIPNQLGPAAEIDTDGNGINVTGDGGAKSGTTTLHMVGGQVVQNDNQGLSVVNTHFGIYTREFGLTSVLAEGTTFGGGTDDASTGNGNNGVDIRFGAKTTLKDCTIDQNGANGVFAERSAGGATGTMKDPAMGKTTIHGGTIEHNGIGTGVTAPDLDWDGDDIPGTQLIAETGDHEFAEDDAGHGILNHGNATVETDKSETTMAKLNVTRNGVTGLFADDGQMNLNNTMFTVNGQNNICSGPTMKVGRGLGVLITQLARMKMVACNTDNNLGAGLVINDDGAPLNFGVPLKAKAPQIVKADAINTVDGSTFNGNKGEYDDACASALDDEPFPRDGVEVMRRGRLYFVGDQSEIDMNSRNGLDVAGQLPYISGDISDVADVGEVDINDNTLDGVVVSCHNLLAGPPPPPAAPGKLPFLTEDDRTYICGFAQLNGGASYKNHLNGAHVFGNLYWSSGDINTNDVDGVVADHAEVAQDFNALPDSFALGWTQDVDLNDDGGGIDHFNRDGDDNYMAPVQSKFVDMKVHNNLNNGYTILAAPWANEIRNDNHLCDKSTWDDASDESPNNTTPNESQGTDIESTRPICDWGVEIKGLGGRINNNTHFGVEIGTDNQKQNIYAKVGDAQIFLNGAPGLLTPPNAPAGGGIDVHQNKSFGKHTCDDNSNSETPRLVRCQCDHSEADFDENGDDVTVGCTATTILSNNIYSNGGPGLYDRRSFQKPLATADRRVVASNEFHHNNVSPNGPTDATCTVEAADEFSSQVVWDGPIGQADPTVSNDFTTGTDVPCEGEDTDVQATVDPNDPHQTGIDCIGPSREAFPADFRCYWGVSTANGRVDTLAACNNVNNPGPTFPESGSINNHCLWNGTQCRIAWDMGGTEGTGDCDSSRNRVFAYINDPIFEGAPATQRGVFSTNGAYTRARRNTWGVGGPVNGVFADANSDSRVDADNDCGSVSTCP